MWKFTEVVVRQKASSLCWQGDRLADWKWGWQMDMDGRSESGCRVGYKFDAAISSPSGRFALLFERLGTKALLLDRGEIVRELSRSYYHADDYEYPAAFCVRADGTELLIHCPREYCRIDIEVAESGEMLAEVPGRDPRDAFHSRFVISADGAFLASAGWLWHPWDASELWSIPAVLEDPRLLDKGFRLFDEEVSSVAFVGRNRLVASVVEGETPREEKLVTVDLGDRVAVNECTLSVIPGTLVPFGKDFVLALMDYPKLLRIADGAIVYEWPQLKTGSQMSSILRHAPLPPPFAKHPTKPIFAVAGEETVTIVKLEGGLE